MTTARLEAGDTTLLVVDMQERLLPAIHESDRVIERACLMMRAAEALGLPVVMTTQYRKGLGATHPTVQERAPGIAPIDKVTFSCFGSPAIAEAVGATGRRSLLLLGVEAHICVLQTGLDALAAGYQVHLVVDACGSRRADNAELGARRLERAGVVLTSTEMAIYELLGSSGSPAFKSLLPYFK